MPNAITAAALAKLIDNSTSVVALTGAGMSTSAGIPDFRGPDGLYASGRYDAEKLFDLRHFKRDPRKFYAFGRDLVAILLSAAPTLSHQFLSQLEAQGKLSGLITQNIDLLHQCAGSCNVLELHGSLGSAVCLDCGARMQDLDLRWWQEAMGADDPVPRCAVCGGALKPGIVFFGEEVDLFREAQKLVEGCDLLLVLGSSLTVAPACRLPDAAGGAVVVISRGEVQQQKGRPYRPQPRRYSVDSDLDAFIGEVSRELAILVADSGPRHAPGPESELR